MNKQELVMSVDSWAHRLAYKNKRNNISKDDLYQQAMLGACKAAELYDENYITDEGNNTSYFAFAKAYMFDAVKKYIISNTFLTSIKTGGNNIDSYLFYNIHTLPDNPTISDRKKLADSIGIGRERVDLFLALYGKIDKFFIDNKALIKDEIYEKIDQEITMSKVLRCIDHLPDKQKEVLGRFLSGQSLNQAGIEMGYKSKGRGSLAAFNSAIKSLRKSFGVGE